MHKKLCIFWMVMIIATVTKAQTNLTIRFYNHPVTNSTEAGQSSFKSNEFIYGRVELGITVKDFFKIKDVTEKYPYPYLQYLVKIPYIDYSTYEHVLRDKENSWKNILLTEEDLNNTYLNIDVLPDPALAKMVLSGTADFSSGLAACPLYHMISPDVFKKNGAITIDILLYQPTNDAWGNLEDKKKWPTVSGKFDFVFNEADIAQLKKNREIANENIQAKGVQVSALPALFSKSDKFTDIELSSSTAFTIIKRDLPKLIIKKWALQNREGWRIINNNNGTPRYKTYNAELHVAYKKDGKCYISEIIFSKSYLGAGKYSKIMAENSQEKMINCTTIK
jgi:hypothetical protein